MTGRHKFVCQICGHTYYSEDKRIRWDGLITCNNDGCVDERIRDVDVKPEDTSVRFPSPQKFVFITEKVKPEDL